ncbi:conserved Plasmodium protein, unknown function [Plasmodium knowlesi strain H]|uniref:Uncharacterized protein n=3 Tax=Plasmodium knowlesi TaxID=5850 RepID=A0A5K1VLZ1_PLAKH|nr:conserved Plasmodium protein, unknown function [Plasmodium knowlesi strain H]OTN67864.1 Uncharacterized protein PKNOH_S05388500 [Plasmodium knowlesi]CAA9990472.1 conserved Plasmodium protein, unknown function [Plasmodium knowlesi strain H]SBO19683.1 conserved Plasmodium protein, unknown function [Plasmodium knowlesi strain H]SBO22491.1 conserved Plasmodium protein, unknown function [Plasmodium knowlesi strain H]VVS79946.1 conserved Plasmodium protein, unknown function [Plasmodium knowlesi s|eukprot:XP_002260861.1 hypothetical protein, conserved in Plasmodium species [Plasmodium knowlesi strain H]
MNSKSIYNAPKVTKEDLEREFDKTKYHLKNSWDELTGGSQYTEEELLQRRRKQDMCKSNFFADCSGNKQQTFILLKGTSKKVHTYIHGALGEYICWEKGSIPIYGKLKTHKKRKKNRHKVSFFSDGTLYMDNSPHTCDGRSDSVGRGIPFAQHNKGSYNTRRIKSDIEKLADTKRRNLNKKASMLSRFDGMNRNDRQNNVYHTSCVKFAEEEKRNMNNGRWFGNNENQTNIPRRCKDQVMLPYSSSKDNEAADILLTTPMRNSANGKLPLRISEKNKLDKMSQVPVEEKLNENSIQPLGDLLKGKMARGGREKGINYREHIMKRSYKSRINHELHADQHNEKQNKSKQVGVGYDIMSKQKRQKGSPNVRIYVDKESTRNSDPKGTIDFVQNCASVEKRMKNYLNEQLKFYGSKLRRENLEQVCFFLRKNPRRRIPHGVPKSNRIDEEEHPNALARPCQNCKKEIKFKNYIMQGDDKKKDATIMINGSDVAPTISEEIKEQMKYRKKEKNERQTTNLAHKNKLPDELKKLKKLQKEEINFFTIYTHLINEKNILKKILDQQTRNNKKDYLKKLILVKKIITNFVTYFEQIFAKIQVEENGSYAPTYNEDRHHNINSLLKLVEDVISILSDHFYHVE